MLIADGRAGNSWLSMPSLIAASPVRDHRRHDQAGRLPGFLLGADAVDQLDGGVRTGLHRLVGRALDNDMGVAAT